MIPDCVCTRNGIPSKPVKRWEQCLADFIWECESCGREIEWVSKPVAS